MDYVEKINFHINKFYKTTKLIFPKLNLKKDITKYRKVSLSVDSDVVVTMLCGKKTIYEGIASLLSFYTTSRKNYSLCIFDDGSLDVDDVQLLNRYFENIKIIWRTDADRTTTRFLHEKGFKKLIFLRKYLIFAARLTDINLLLPGKTVIQLDSDVLTIQYPAELIEIAESKTANKWAYNQDVMNSYCLPKEEIFERTGINIVDSFNAGLCLYTADEKHLGFLEKALDKILTTELYYTEQTLTALLMTVQKAEVLPPDYDLGFRCYDNPAMTPLNVKTRHYCGYAREYFYPHFRILTEQYSQTPAQ